MNNFALPIIGFGDEQTPPMTVVWRDGTVICRGYGGILGSWPEPEPQLHDNVVSLDQWRKKNDSLRQRPI
jgi:hypothetical protein